MVKKNELGDMLSFPCLITLVRFHILAVLSPLPLASRSCLGFQAQMKTSLSCPFRTVLFSAEISVVPSSNVILSK